MNPHIDQTAMKLWSLGHTHHKCSSASILERKVFLDLIEACFVAFAVQNPKASVPQLELDTITSNYLQFRYCLGQLSDCLPTKGKLT